MVRRLAVLCLAWVSLALPGQAQERSFISGDDTLHYVYTPLPVDSSAAAAMPGSAGIPSSAGW